MIIQQSDLEKMDKAYQQYTKSSIQYLVKTLRKIRRQVEQAPVSIEDSATILTDFATFYGWAHNRYPALEDDPKVPWIGMD